MSVSLFTQTPDLKDMSHLEPLRVHFLPFLVPGDPWLWVSSGLAHEGGHPSRHTDLVHRLFDEHRGTFRTKKRNTITGSDKDKL